MTTARVPAGMAHGVKVALLGEGAYKRGFSAVKAAGVMTAGAAGVHGCRRAVHMRA
jgi:hypothetical protein